MVNINDLVIPLSEHIKEELSDIEIEIHSNKRIYLYSNTGHALMDGSMLSTCVGALEIKEDKIIYVDRSKRNVSDTITIFDINAQIDTKRSNVYEFDLSNPGCFDDLFSKIKKTMDFLRSVTYITYNF
jgi:hypothetical protein